MRTPGGVAMSERQTECWDGQVLAVTTRSRLRSARFFPAMLLATWAIRRQLARTDGLVRWASLVAGPTEFWTITVWRSRHAMQEFMRSDAHGRIMWRYTRWLDGLWLMQWRPGAVEVGSWAGVTLAPGQVHPGLAATVELDRLRRTPQRLPDLHSVVGPGGSARDPSSRHARRPRAQVEGAQATVVRIRVPALQTPTVLVELLRLRRRLAADPDLLRSVVGLGSPGEICFLGIWRAGDAQRDSSTTNGSGGPPDAGPAASGRASGSPSTNSATGTGCACGGGFATARHNNRPPRTSRHRPWRRGRCSLHLSPPRSYSSQRIQRYTDHDALPWQKGEPPWVAPEGCRL